MYFISNNNLADLLDILKKDYDVFVPVEKENKITYRKYKEFIDNIIVIGGVRSFEPLKAFFTRSREIVSKDFKSDVPHSKDKPYCILGVKNCDLNGFNVQDHVFTSQDFNDPLYNKNREENLVIASDCICCLETCFCLALGNKPYPEKNFDISLSELENGYVVEIGSEKGEKLIEKNSDLFEKATSKQIQNRDNQRQRVIDDIQKNIERNEVPDKKKLTKDLIQKNFESTIWEDEANTCVECGACTIICPSCHCFLLYDEKDDDQMQRLRIWDSCMFKDYARVAGGANPRERLWMRLRNRFVKKFEFFPKVTDTYGCTGCGRCISACPAKIDIRKVLKRLVNNE